MYKVKIKKFAVCPLCDGPCKQDRNDKHFHRCEQCDQNYYVSKRKIEFLPMSGVRSIRMVSEMISDLRNRGLLTRPVK